MNIFKYEFSMYKKSIITWSVSILLFWVMYMAFYPAFGENIGMMDEMMANFPEEFTKAFGMNGDLPLSSVLGYFAFVFTFAQLFIAIQSANYGFSFLSIEERELTADFLMSKPVSRSTIFISKFLAAFLSLMITNLVVIPSGFLAIIIFAGDKTYDTSKLILLFLTIPLFQLYFMSIGMLISMIVKKIRSVLTLSLSLAFALYILNAIRSIIGGELLGMISAFYHFNPNFILEFGKLDIKMTLVSVVVTVFSIITSYVLYLKRDIHSL